MSDNRPGFNPLRLVKLMEEAIQRCQLDLHGRTILTEAATGAYVITPIMAVMAGAPKALAIAHPSRHGTVEQVREQTEQLAEQAGVRECIEVFTEKSRDIIARADIITNSGHVRPIDHETVSWMKPTAVVPLMYEAWEFRPGDVDLAACHDRGILVAGTNERHPAIDVFSFLGMMAVKLLIDAGVAVYTSRILLLCDNPFASFIERSLTSVGANLDTVERLSRASSGGSYDVILVALRPGPEPVLSAEDTVTIRNRWPAAVVAQFWGDVDRSALSVAAIPVWPPEAPAPGHMAVLPSDLGPEPVVRLQAGGLKVGELLSRPGSQLDGSWADLAQMVEPKNTYNARRVRRP